MGIFDYFLQTAVVCHKGNVRSANEDNFYYYGGLMERNHDGMNLMDSKSWTAVGCGCLTGVFDGMGGYSNGELSSYLAAMEIKKNAARLEKNTNQKDIPAMLTDICLRANDAVCNESVISGCKMGTTAAILFFKGNSVWVCNIGDSPVYCFRQGRLLHFYEEHTERTLHEHLCGEVTQAHRKYPLTQHIGIFQEDMIIEPYVSRKTLCDGDVFLLCTDGLTDMLEEPEIERILGQKKTAKEMVRQLRDAALDRGGFDNITIIIVRVNKRYKSGRASGLTSRMKRLLQ